MLSGASKDTYYAVSPQYGVRDFQGVILLFHFSGFCFVMIMMPLFSMAEGLRMNSPFNFPLSGRADGRADLLTHVRVPHYAVRQGRDRVEIADG